MGKTEHSKPQENTNETTTQTATFGAGCFWCVEAVFQQVEGVTDVQSGYTGGETENPTYEQVCSGTTEHAEVCKIQFDPDRVSFAELLEIFWKTHDPTTLNRQGADTGTQYRSAIFYHDEEQERVAKELRDKFNAADLWPDPIVTEIVPAAKFYPAEKYHDDYYRRNPEQGYCRVIIDPKMAKFRESFADKLKP